MKKEDRTGYAIIIVIFLITAIIGYQIYKSITEEEKTYEFAKNGEIFKSNNCYVKDDICYCEYENKLMQIDNYYER